MKNTNVETAANAPKLERYRLLALARDITFGHAVSTCLLYPVEVHEPVSVLHDSDRREARFRNVQTCKSVWACPVCADRISRVRASDLLRGMENWVRGGNRVAMATYTLAHAPNEACADVLARLQAAYRRFKGDRAYKRASRSWGIRGGVRVLETTYGANGWHWHIHELYFLAGTARGRHGQMKSELSAHWGNVVRAVGGTVNSRGYDLARESAAAFDYVSRFGSTKAESGWGLALEVTRAPAKIRAGAAGLHPFQILASAGRPAASADRRAWQEYVVATKGVNQLVYSRGLRALLGLDAVEDADAAIEREEAVLPVIARITSRGWYTLNRRDLGLFPEFKQVADVGDPELLAAWLDQYDIETVALS